MCHFGRVLVRILILIFGRAIMVMDFTRRRLDSKNAEIESEENVLKLTV